MRKIWIIVAGMSAALAVGGCGTVPTTSSTSVAEGATACTYTPTGTAAREVELPPATDVAATGTTSLTLMVNDEPVQLTLDREQAPCTVNSFVSLAQQGYFDGVSCHRLSDSGGLYMLQCGDPTGTGSGRPGYTFADELEGTTGYPAGTLAMANSGPDTNGSQFFIVYQDSSALQLDYTVFGTVEPAGLDVIKQIAALGHDSSFPNGGGKPNVPAVITSVTAG